MPQARYVKGGDLPPAGLKFAVGGNPTTGEALPTSSAKRQCTLKEKAKELGKT